MAVGWFSSPGAFFANRTRPQKKISAGRQNPIDRRKLASGSMLSSVRPQLLREPPSAGPLPCILHEVRLSRMKRVFTSILLILAVFALLFLGQLWMLTLAA